MLLADLLRLAGVLTEAEPWREQRTAAASTGTNVIDTRRAQPGWLHIVDRAVVADLTTAATSWRVGTFDGSSFVVAEEQRSPAANTHYWTEYPVVVYEGQSLRAEIQGATAGDVLVLNIWGYRVKRVERAVPTVGA